jgi:hypothetical protein
MADAEAADIRMMIKSKIISRFYDGRVSAEE